MRRYALVSGRIYVYTLKNDFFSSTNFVYFLWNIDEMDYKVLGR